MRGKLTTHVLDITHGTPAVGVNISLYRKTDLLVTAFTNEEGRLDTPLLSGETFARGLYRIEFKIGDYFAARGHPDARRFLDIVPVVFTVDDPSRAYHVPLLVSPWSYSVYRGS